MNKFNRKSEEDHVFFASNSGSLLVIDDDLSVILYLEHIIEILRPGLRWDFATSCEHGIELLKQRSDENPGVKPYNFVLVDIFLGGEMTGFDFWFHCRHEYPDLPVVMISSMPVEEYLAILNGVKSSPLLVPKPLSVESCKSIIEEYL